MKKSFLILTSTLLLSESSHAGVQDLIKRFDAVAETNSIIQPKKVEFKHQLPLITPEKKTWGGVVSSPLKGNSALPFSAKVNHFKNIFGEMATKPKKKVTFSEAEPEVREFQIEEDNRIFKHSRHQVTKTKYTNYYPTFREVSNLGVDTSIYQGQIEFIESDIKRQSASYNDGIGSVVKQYNKGLEQSGKKERIFVSTIFQEDFLQQIEDKDSPEQALENILSEGFLEDMAQEARKIFNSSVNTTVMLPLIKCGNFIGGLNGQRDLTNDLDESDKNVNAQLLKFFTAPSLDAIQGTNVSFIVTQGQSEYPAYLVAKLQGDPHYMTIDPTETVKLPTAAIVYGERQIEEENTFSDSLSDDEYESGEDEMNHEIVNAEDDLKEKELTPEEEVAAKEFEEKLRKAIFGK